MKRALIAALAVALNAGCVATYVRVPDKATVVRFALFYSADFSVSTNGVEAYRGKGDAAAIKAAGEAGGQAVVSYLKSKGL
jgi:hypothetical protein